MMTYHMDRAAFSAEAGDLRRAGEYCCCGRPDERIFALDGAADLTELELGDIHPAGGGAMVELSVCLKAVLPGRRVALGVLLYEDTDGGRRACGMRVCSIPPHREPAAADIRVEGVGFVVPGGAGERRFAARVLAHYADIDECTACSVSAGKGCAGPG